MKKFLLYISLAATSLTACYDDKGGNDFDTPLDDVEMIIPETAYSTGLGSTITITPEVTTTIPESDLKFYWETLGDKLNDLGEKTFSLLVPEEEQAKVLTYTGHLDDNIGALNTSYTCRLRAHQISTGRDFYSANQFTLTIAGATGLMMLYGDNNSSDIGILQANEFTPSAISFPEKPTALTALYSTANGGEKLQGKGKTIVQNTSEYLALYSAMLPQLLPRCGQIVAMMDNGATWMDKDGLKQLGDWNHLFYIKDKDAVNDNRPKGFYVYMVYLYAFDGDDFFTLSTLSSFPFLFAECTPETVYTDGNQWNYDGNFLVTGISPFQVLMYAESVNGDSNHKGFIGGRSPNPGYFTNYCTLLDSQNDPAVFNPGNMQADLVKMCKDNRGHVMAVLKGDATHSKFASKYFAVDLQLNAPASADAKTAYNGIGRYIYDLSGMTDIDKAISFEFGATQNMCYYATPSGVYQYRVDASSVSAAEKLGMSDGSAWPCTGEVTMMKILDTSVNTPTHDRATTILVVGTYEAGSAALWALHMDTMSGRINKAVKYDASNVDNWGFNQPIIDVNIKTM